MTEAIGQWVRTRLAVRLNQHDPEQQNGPGPREERTRASDQSHQTPGVYRAQTAHRHPVQRARAGSRGQRRRRHHEGPRRAPEAAWRPGGRPVGALRDLRVHAHLSGAQDHVRLACVRGSAYARRGRTGPDTQGNRPHPRQGMRAVRVPSGSVLPDHPERGLLPGRPEREAWHNLGMKPQVLSDAGEPR